MGVLEILVGLALMMAMMILDTKRMSDKYEKQVYLAMLAEQCSRYEDMMAFLEDMVKAKSEDLSSDERNLLSIAYKNTISLDRQAIRTLLAYESKEAKKAESPYLDYIKEYKAKVQKELEDLCNKIIEENKLSNEKLINLEKKCKELLKSNELLSKKNEELEQKNLALEKKFEKIENYCFKILKKEDIKTLNGWISQNKKIKYILKYNAKRDGCDTDIFHEKCDNLGKSLIICKTSSGAIVGAYMTTDIEKKKGYKSDPNAFLFNLTNKLIKKNLKQKYHKAIYNYDDNSNFIKFGECDCFRLAGNCLYNKNSYADICHCATNFDCQSKNILNGGNGEPFQVDNFEVYQILIE